jgi:hypothetical protein
LFSEKFCRSAREGLIKSGVGGFFIQSLSFPRRRESRNVLLKKLDARLRGHDGKNSPTAQLSTLLIS